MIINYTFNQSTEQQIRDHLWRMDSDFTPPLHTYVDINKYAKKLATNAVRIDSLIGLDLIGLIATYYNPEKQFLFVSNISIEKEYRGQGIEISRGLVNFLAENQNPNSISPEIKELANNWIKILAEDAKPNNLVINSIHTEVRNSNRNALLFYKRLGFEEVELSNGSTYLVKNL